MPFKNFIPFSMLGITFFLNTACEESANKNTTLAKNSDTTESSINKNSTMKDIGFEQAKNLLESGAQFVDARIINVGDDVIGSQTINITPADDDSKIEQLLTNKRAEIVVYCANQRCTASDMVAEKLAKLGYENVYHYGGGIKDWLENKQEVEGLKAKIQ